VTETLDENKAVRYLGAGRVTVRQVDRHAVFADVIGDSGLTYRVERSADLGGWLCSCPHRHGCAHLAAVHLVVEPGG
jgi:uncharacterized Zn finger protein